MITSFEFEQLTRKVIDTYQSLLDKYKEEIKKYGNPCSETIRMFNALYLQMNVAASSLDKGLNGLFPFEEV